MNKYCDFYESISNNMIKNVKVYGIDESIKASKYPMTVDIDSVDSSITNTVVKLGQSSSGSAHDNYLKGIVVQFDLGFTIKAWTEAERYHWFEIVSSQSTMHRINKMDPRYSCVPYVSPIIIDELNRLIDKYNNDPTLENYLSMIYSVPVGLKLYARITTNYLQLKTIFYQRNTHRLPEWRILCNFIKELPKFSELILNK